jgi:hypothetical protein
MLLMGLAPYLLQLANTRQASTFHSSVKKKTKREGKVLLGGGGGWVSHKHTYIDYWRVPPFSLARLVADGNSFEGGSFKNFVADWSC